MKTTGRPQQIIAATVQRGETVDCIFLAWLWEDFQETKRERDALLAACKLAYAFEWTEDRADAAPVFKALKEAIEMCEKQEEDAL